jgi:hypothetical protein
VPAAVLRPDRLAESGDAEQALQRGIGIEAELGRGQQRKRALLRELNRRLPGYESPPVFL